MPKPDPTQCATSWCRRPPRCAVRTTRPTRPDVRVTLYTDDRTAPATASRYCHQCAVKLMADLVGALVDMDDPEPPTVYDGPHSRDNQSLQHDA